MAVLLWRIKTPLSQTKTSFPSQCSVFPIEMFPMLSFYIPNIFLSEDLRIWKPKLSIFRYPKAHGFWISTREFASAVIYNQKEQASETATYVIETGITTFPRLRSRSLPELVHTSACRATSGNDRPSQMGPGSTHHNPQPRMTGWYECDRNKPS